MALTGYIKSLFSDKEKTSPLFPITKTKAVIDDEGKSLDELLGDAIFVDDGADEATGYVNADTLNGKAESELSVANAGALGGKAPEYYIQPRNLLDNSDFTNPVNQRGLTSGDGGYMIDRWECYNTTINDDGIVLSANVNSYILQKIPPELQSCLMGKAVTLAFCVNGKVRVVSHVLTSSDNKWEEGVGIQVNSAGQHEMCLGMTASEVNTVQWAALYEGEYTAETLPPYVPKGYGAELLECQRYFERKNVNVITRNLNSVLYSTYFMPKRIKPTVEFTNTLLENLTENLVLYSVYNDYIIASFGISQTPSNYTKWVGFVDISADL